MIAKQFKRHAHIIMQLGIVEKTQPTGVDSIYVGWGRFDLKMKCAACEERRRSRLSGQII